MAHALIVGAGPAGASLALLLARRGIRVTLLERQSDFEREFRGEVLMPSGLDALGQMGLAAALERVPTSRIEQVGLYANRRRAGTLRLPADLSVRAVAQPAMLEMLVAEAARLPCFHLERGATVRDLLFEDGRACGVRVERDGSSRELRADFVIGTDGRASLLRRRAGLDQPRRPQRFDVVWARLPLPAAIARDREARFYVGQGHFLVMYPSHDGLLQVGWVIRKGGFGELRRLGVEGWIREMSAHVSPDLAEHLLEHRRELTAPFLLDVVSDRLRRWTAAGLLLLGDAAHPMSPVGGQGINIALRDVIVAANLLAPALERGANALRLDQAARQVQAERLREVGAVQRLQAIPPRIIFRDGALSRALIGALPFALRSGLGPLLAARLARRITRGVTQVRLRPPAEA
jgi:2-polyprenyl-6-methoxyphenol hydroxylase-like FAD-dependent oxidoreductase